LNEETTPSKRGKSKAKAKAAATLPTKAALLEFIRTQPAKIGKREIARAFNLKGDARIALKQLLRELAEEGRVTKTRKRLRGRGTLRAVMVLEITRLDDEGELYAAPVDWNASEGTPPRIRMIPKPGIAPGNGDHVLCRVSPAENDESADYTASPIKLLAREKPRQLGIYRKTPGGPIIEPVDKKALREWRIGPDDRLDAEDGDLVRFEVDKTGRTLNPRARVVERIGAPESERAISQIAIENYNLPDVFPKAVIAELDGLKAPTLRGREDLRKIPLVTIDPADAKDHDDAVWAAPDEDPANEGGHVVIVAIADVSFYVRSGTALDAEAVKRGNSVYFPDRVVPMLPEKLSNDLCSLIEGVDRPCLAVRMVFDKEGKKLSHRFMRGMMRSAAKLAYAEAQAAIDGKPSAKTKPLLDPVLKPLWAAYETLKKERNKRGPLDLDLPERKILLDENGHVARVVSPERLDAHRLIEEFMIQANVAAAEALEAANSPLLYRIHDAPSDEKINALGEFLETIGLSIAKGTRLQPMHFNRILAKTREGEFSELVSEVVLRSQAQAEYSARNLGHFGLNLRRYAHFTSPIRRYADLIVHRGLVAAMKLGPGGLTAAEIGELDQIAEQISQAERRAMAAERETVDRLIALHMAGHMGETFTGRVAGVTRSGLFVKLAETGADGFIPASTIGRDYYVHSEAQHALIGERTGEAYRLGDTVEVKLVEAHPSAGALRFQLVSEGRYDLKLARGKGAIARRQQRPSFGPRGRRRR
jgi:ribonuclease R